MTRLNDLAAVERPKNGTGPWVRWGIGILFALMVTVSAWGMGLANRVTALESERRTERDEAALQRQELNQRLQTMEADIKLILQRTVKP